MKHDRKARSTTRSFPFPAKGVQGNEHPEELKEWERLMKEEVGLTADIANLSGTCTESTSASQSDDCDQD